MLPRHAEVHKIKDGLRHKNNKWLWKRYEPHCPSRTCTGGHRNKLHRIGGKPSWLGQQLWDKKKEVEILCRCSYRGLVWFQKDSEKPGFDASPVGYYDDFEHPWEFVPLRKRFQFREQNTRSYWYSVRRKGDPSAKMGRSGLAQRQRVHREMKFEGFEEKVLAKFLFEIEFKYAFF